MIFFFFFLKIGQIKNLYNYYILLYIKKKKNKLYIYRYNAVRVNDLAVTN